MVLREISSYDIFHIHRIISVLLESEYARNDHNADKTSSNGYVLLTTPYEKRERILASMRELGLLSGIEYDKIKKILLMEEAEDE